jgi:hypothetical protein
MQALESLERRSQACPRTDGSNDGCRSAFGHTDHIAGLYYVDGRLLVEELDLNPHDQAANVILHGAHRVIGIKRNALGNPVNQFPHNQKSLRCGDVP